MELGVYTKDLRNSGKTSVGQQRNMKTFLDGDVIRVFKICSIFKQIQVCPVYLLNVVYGK